MDQWVAECAPCQWSERFDDQEPAITAATDHALDHHRELNNQERARQRIGHVQLRSPNTIATLEPESELEPEEELEEKSEFEPEEGELEGELEPEAESLESEEEE